MNHRPTLRELVERAVSNDDAEAADQVVSCLRFRYHMTYEQIYDFAYRITEVPVAQWDALLEENP